MGYPRVNSLDIGRGQGVAKISLADGNLNPVWE
jgi:hypothetical protein